MNVFGWLLVFIIVANVCIGLWRTKKWEDQNRVGQTDKELERKNEVHLFTFLKR